MPNRPRLLSDVTPLRESRQYRVLYVGELLAFLGSQITVVAVPLQVYLLTHSSLAVGLVGLAQLGPLLACALVGGVLVDAVDRRVLLIWVQLARAALSAGLVVNALQPRPSLWPLYVLTAAGAGLQAVDGPARTAAIPALVRRELLAAAAALHQIVMTVGVVAGPALAGLIIGRVSLAAAYGIDVATFAIATGLAVALRPLPPGAGATRAGVGSIREGFRFLRGRLASIHIAVVTGGPRLGDAEAGAVAALAGTRFSVVSGGLACLAGVALLAWRIPELGRTVMEPSRQAA
jgi:MFS family permease